MQPSARAAADHGLAALLGEEMHVDGFRFDLASALARELHDGRPPRRLLRRIRQDPVLSQRQADRRALGPRRGRLPGRQLPARLGRVERQVPRHACAPTGRATAACIGEFAPPPHRLDRSLRAQRPRARTRASTSSPRTTASRCTTWCRYNDKHNEANGEDNRDGNDNNLSLELRRRRADRRPRDHWRCASARSATCSPRCCSRRACRCCWPATRSGARRAATTTPTARTTRSAGSTGTLDDEQRAPARASRGALIALRRAPPGLPRGATSSAAARCRRASVKDIVWLEPDGDEMTDEEWDHDFARCLGVYPVRRGARRGRRARPAGRRRRLPAAVQRPPRRRRRSALPDAPATTTGGCCSTPRETGERRAGAASAAGDALSAAAAARWCCCSASRRPDAVKARATRMPFGAAASTPTAARVPPVGAGRTRVDLALQIGRRTRSAPHARAATTAGSSSTSPAPAPATRYRFRIDGGSSCPTRPRASIPTTCTARARSSIRAPYDWPDGDWRGRPWHEAVIYELHVGTFTPEGTFAAAVERARRPGRARRHRDRADAGRRLPGRAQLGLRRRAAVRARRGLRHAGRPEAPRRRARTRAG